MSKIGTSKHINETLEQYNLRAKKKFGQNFLNDQNILQKIVKEAHVDSKTLVIEIGPGLGSLTEHLLQHANHVLAYEIDDDLIPILDKQFQNNAFTLLHKDFLEAHIDDDIRSLNIDVDKVIVVANLPYYITTPIIMKMLEESKLISEYFVMMQLEVARRFTSKPKTKDYNSLSVFMQYKAYTSIVMTVPKTVFIPAPNVDSAVVKITVKDTIMPFPKDEKLFFSLVRNSFSMRRKTLVNNLSSSMGISKIECINMLETLGYNPSIRAEELTVSDFITIADYLSQ